MTATVALSGAFLPLTATAIVALVLVARRPVARLLWALLDVAVDLWDSITRPPAPDVLGSCQEFDRCRVFRDGGVR